MNNFSMTDIIEIIIVCPKCGKHFSDNATLVDYITGIKFEICPICENRFTAKPERRSYEEGKERQDKTDKAYKQADE